MSIVIIMCMSVYCNCSVNESVWLLFLVGMCLVAVLCIMWLVIVLFMNVCCNCSMCECE